VSEEEELEVENPEVAEVVEVVEVAEDESSSAASIVFPEDEFADLYVSSGVEERILTPCQFITGRAGTGKTRLILDRCEEDPFYAILSASTGIAAVNLNATTIHSLLGFFDYASLRDAYLRKSAQRKLRTLAQEGYKNVVLDEMSMVPHYTLDTLVAIFDEVNNDLRGTQHPIGLILVGDIGQLGPIPEQSLVQGKRERKPTPWCFDAVAWPRFEDNTTKLTKVWRQTDQEFLAALDHARAGRGSECVEILAAAGLQFETFTDIEFDGTTILSENKHVDAFNMEAMKRVKGRPMFLPSRRWGKERSEWKNIPLQTQVCEGAYVMILANQSAGRGQFTYVNGDCGYIKGITQRAGAMPFINIELVRTGNVVQVPTIVRSVDHSDKPEGFVGADNKVPDSYHPKPHFNTDKRRYVSGQVQYYPIRLAYATTPEKSQGLSLDRVQVDMRNWRFGNPAMAYITMSRCRTMEGLRLVGMKEVVAGKCKADSRVARWL
jgi:hypothetical protein